MILGVDEVGRGCWAGPLVVGAVVLGGGSIDGLTDSKKLSKRRREQLDKIIREQAPGIGLGWVEASEIDNIGLSKSLCLATKRAVEQIKTPYNEIIIDGTVNFLRDTTKGRYVTTMKKADLLVPSVSAASIVAKVARDNFMIAQNEAYPGYGFASHVGYGTSRHVTAIENLGVTPLHRLSFAPLNKYRQNFQGEVIVANETQNEQMTTKQIGNKAEDAATRYLQGLGHEILARNWRNRLCEIDIISTKDDRIYFSEVKYRRSEREGGGLEAITPRKLKQMKFAAQYYLTVNNFDNIDASLAVISITEKQLVVDAFLELG